MATEKKNAGDSESTTASVSVRSRQLSELLARHKGERHAIALQDYPDPDAMSSGLKSMWIYSTKVESPIRRIWLFCSYWKFLS
jgi:hypothetical protein